MVELWFRMFRVDRIEVRGPIHEVEVQLGGQDNAIDENVDEQPVQDLALNVDNVFQADDCDAFDSDVYEAPMAQTMFMANLSSADPVNDEARTSYDSDILSEVQDHDQYQDVVRVHHEEHAMHDNVQVNHVVDSHADYTSDSNMISYDQYVKDNAVPVVHIVENSLTAELATYKEQVELYERRARKHAEIEQKNLLIANDNLIAECLSKEVFSVAMNSELNVARFTKMHIASTSVEARCLELKVELSNLRDKSHNDNHDELVNHFSNSEVTALTTKNVNLKAQILDTVNSVSKDHVKPKVLTPGKYAIDVEPIIPRLRNNREALLDYLSHHKESVETIRKIVEEAKVARPLDSSIVSACRYTKHSQELLEYAIGTCPQDSHQRDKKLVPAPLFRKKQVTFTEPFDMSNRVNRCTNASGSQPRSNTKKNRISPAKGVNKLQVIQIVLWYLDSDCSKHMTGDRSRLMNFVKKFIGIVRFGNDHFGAIMGYGDYVISDNVISRNDVVERQNRTLVEAARTMLIFSKALIEDLGKLQPTADIGILVGYVPSRKGPAPIFLMPGQIILGLVPNSIPATPYVPPTNKDLEILFHPMFDEYLEPPRVERPVSPAPAVQALVNSAGTPSSTTIDQDAPSPSISPSSSALQSHSLHQGIAVESTLIEDNLVAPVDNNRFINEFAPEPSSDTSSYGDVSSTESTYVSQTIHHLNKWSKDYPLDNVIGNPSRSVSTRKQLAIDAL
uniref:Integrase, catalytic region, zinc finger, CCHC-type, peptidase aspartic, catalytic n=1 Tax=Tanacetum cinerariifolium TaxID=118510 RepID=A0A6L2N9T4_TANCI|nr:integrase, catalytic region, zinc finger, CCHC-type, peptidase aspartic, catalytic [Tanacetum cinerariifolium]